VTEHEPDSWTEPLDQGRVRLVPPPPQPPGELPPAELAHARLAIGKQARVLFAVTAPPPPRRAACDPVALAGLAGVVDRARRPAPAGRTAAGSLLADHHARLDAGQAAAGAELERWQRDLVPAYQRAREQVYRQTRSEGPPLAVPRSAGRWRTPPVSGGGAQSWADGPARADRPWRSGPAGYSQPPGPPR
jgi:hypothetical protein